MILTDEIKELFSIIRTQLGAPIRRVELSDDSLCNLLKVSVGDYSEKIQNWVLMTQWINLQGKDRNHVASLIQNGADYAYMMTIRSFDWARDYSQYFSREVGLQQRGSYELKKDFFQVERGKQVYVVPKGREINSVMYVTPSTTKAALYGAYGIFDGGFGGGFAQVGNINYGMGLTRILHW